MLNYLTLHDLAVRWGLKYNTILQRRHQGKLPEPDAMVGRTPAWLPETIEQWESNGHHRPNTEAR